MSTSTSADQPPDPAAEIVDLFPNKQMWSVSECFKLTNSHHRRVENADS